MTGKSRAMIDQIRQMHAAGCSIKKIAQALKASRNTVRKYLRAEVAAITSALPPSPPTPEFDWETAAKEARLGRPLKRIFEEMAPAMSYAHFTRAMRHHVKPEPTVAMRLHHEPGEKAQVDYGEGLMITDHRSGKETPTQFFCGVLPASSFTFGEFTMSQKLPDFIRSHERMWTYFGGVASYVVLDNLKSGVTRAHRYDPDVNPTYTDYANHAGFAALPARVRTPRDKAAVEAAIGVIQRDFFDRFRARKFYSLHELNSEFRKYLDDFNLKEMPQHGCSRLERFEIEREKLKPLAASTYELYEWKKAKVHPDSCIELQKSVYSVPYRYVHQYVQVKYSDRLVIILDANDVIATHARQPRYKHSIDQSHLPEAKTQLKSFNILKIQKFGDGIGPKTRAYIDWQFALDQPLRALRRMMGLLRFHETRSPSREAMEHAAAMAISFHKHDLNYFLNCAQNFSGPRPSLHLITPPTREIPHIHVRPHTGE